LDSWKGQTNKNRNGGKTVCGSLQQWVIGSDPHSKEKNRSTTSPTSTMRIKRKKALKQNIRGMEKTIRPL
jgi:hypothetical protein